MTFTKPIALFIFLCSLSLFSQKANSQDDNLSLDGGTLDNQFEYVITKSTGWNDERGQNYRVIKTFWLTKLKESTLDSIALLRKEFVSTDNTIKAQAKEIEDLKLNLSNNQNSLNKIKDEKDNVSVFGAQISKSSYSALMWSIIGFLLVALLFFIYKFNNSNAVTKHAKQVLQDLEDEYEEHRKTAVEREQKVRRQLQDEINKQKIIKPKK
jgi:large-conductance mechanosensitive channel